ncbi:amino acid racemase [bacterium]|nr:amino acid racemase [bacterium]
MPKHIGIIGNSFEGAALCYRTICLEASRVYGYYDHPEITMHTYEPERYFAHVYSGDWEGVALVLADSAKKLAACGANFAICPDNTNHRCWKITEQHSPIPLISIVEVVGNEINKMGFNKVGLLGTRFTMSGPFYPEILNPKGIEVVAPDPEDQTMIHDIIFQELIFGISDCTSREKYVEVIRKFREQGCGGVILGCTEIPLLITERDSPLPILDSTRLLAKAALQYALKD